MRKQLLPELARRLLIHRSVLEFIEQEAAKASSTETGGVLAGAGDLADGVIHVTHASKPGPRARKSPFFFARDTEYCQHFVDKLAKDSLGQIDYLGEWHKHHERIPRPSGKDIVTSTQIALSANYHVNACLLMIIGKSNRRDSLRCFVVDQKGYCVRADWEICNG